MSIQENKAIAHRWGDEIWGKGSLAAIDELFATDFVHNYPPPGREGYKQNVTDWFVAFPDIQYITEDMVAEGDKVAIRWAYRGTHQGEFMGIAPTGKQVTMKGISIIRIVGGTIVEVWDEVDSLGIMQQLGVFPPSE